MKTVLRTLAVIAFLILVTQTVRHAYLLWFEPRGSVLDKYDQPLKGEIEGAHSLDELVSSYDKVRKDVDRAKKERSEKGQRLEPGERYEMEPYKSERTLREAITGWEEKSKEIRALRFYSVIGLVLAVLGGVVSKKSNRWFGLSLLVAGFSEIIYWTSPTFLGGPPREFDRLLVHKLLLSALSLALLVASVVYLQVFGDEKSPVERRR